MLRYYNLFNQTLPNWHFSYCCSFDRITNSVKIIFLHFCIFFNYISLYKSLEVKLLGQSIGTFLIFILIALQKGRTNAYIGQEDIIVIISAQPHQLKCVKIPIREMISLYLTCLFKILLMLASTFTYVYYSFIRL